MSAPEASAADVATGIAAVLRPILGDDVRIDRLQRLTGGASRITHSFDAVAAGRRRALILRTAAADQHAGLELEAAAQTAARASGTPVPNIVLASDSAGALGNPFLISDAVPGETIVRRIQRQLASDPAAPGRLLAECAQALAAIHRTPPEVAEPLPADPLSECRTRLDELGDTTATFEWALRWLTANQPSPSPQVLVHGDFRMGNLIVDEARLSAVLDWELVHIGEPCEDLAWFCIRAWRFGAPPALAAGGLGRIEDFVAAYQQAGGAAVGHDVLHWWMVLSTLRWGIICRAQAERHLTGQTRSVELAAIGRRVCETEWDILDLLEAGR